VGCLLCQESLARDHFHSAARPGPGTRGQRGMRPFGSALSRPPFSHSSALWPLVYQAPGAGSEVIADRAQQRRCQQGRGSSTQPRVRYHTGSPGSAQRARRAGRTHA